MHSGSGNGRRRDPWTVELGGSRPSSHEQDGINGSTMRGALVATAEAWNEIGLELMRVDPKRFAAILRVAEDICKIHRDPLTDNVASGHYILTDGDGGDLS